MNREDIVDSFIEIELTDGDGFLKVRETLERVGIASKKENILWQSCHILHKKGRYYIVHFKELFLLDGRAADFHQDDRARRNSIAKLLEDWGLVRILNKDLIDCLTEKGNLKIIKHQDKANWEQRKKYTIGG